MRASDFIKEEEQLNELLPLVVAGAKGVAAVAKGAAKVGGANNGAQTAVGRVGKPMGSTPTQGNPNATQTNTPQQAAQQQQAPNPQQQQAADRAKDKMIKPGQSIPLPTQQGSQSFKVGKIQGDEVEIENPAAQADPTQPKKVVYKKDDLKRSLTV
jgi:hypothetical protein